MSDIENYLKYANLQMAAESPFGVQASDTPGTITGEGSMTVTSLTLGNGRASLFPEKLAVEFLNTGWEVVEHKSDTTTGFSGTLFRNNQTGELVLSFRSTEFIDDAARDNQATNALEIRERGWAFGQIDDMQQWFTSLQTSGKLDPSVPITVTGYSLGGHLATAFSLLHKDDLTASGAPLISATYTFNGAGVGTVTEGSLQSVINVFHSIRTSENNAALFLSSTARDLYAAWATRVRGDMTLAMREVALADITTKLQLTVDPLVRAELAMLREAVDRGRVVLKEALWVQAGIDSGSNTSAAAGPVNPEAVEAIGLDYQLAVLVASRQTSNWRTELNQAIEDLNNDVRWSNGGLANVYDVSADSFPSAVSNSQLHYGVDTPVYIEDQPCQPVAGQCGRQHPRWWFWRRHHDRGCRQRHVRGGQRRGRGDRECR